MKQSLFTVEHTRQLNADTYEMILSGDTSAITATSEPRATPMCSSHL